MITHGFPVALAAIFFVGGVIFWGYKRLHRISAIFFGAAAFLLAVGFAPWTDALASLVASGAGLTVLIIVTIVSGFGFWFEAVLKHMHHRIRTPVMAITFGTALMLTIGSLAHILSEAAKSPAKTGTALAQSVAEIRSGRAAASVPPGHGLQVLGIGAAALMVLIVAAHRVENRKKGAGSAAAGRPAIGGRRPAALPAGRRR